MPTLAEIRAKYPQYNDLPDGELAEGLYRKFYADMPRPDFDKELGLSAANPKSPELYGPAPEPADNTARDMAKTTLEGVGGMAGSIAGQRAAAAGGRLGATLGRAGGLPGMIAGGALGAAGGYLAGESMDDVLRQLGELEGKSKDAIERSIEAAKVALKDAGWSMGMGITGRFAKPFTQLAGQMMGLGGDAMRKALQTAESFGIDLGAAHVGNVVPKMYGRVAGIFPFTGAPMRKGQQKVNEQIGRAGQNLLGDIAPERSAFDVSGEMLGAAKSRYGAQAKQSTKNYEDFYETAGKLTDPYIVPTDSLKAAAKEITERQAGPNITLATGETMGRHAPEAASVSTLVADLNKLPDYISPTQARELEKDLNRLSRKLKLDGEDTSAITSIKSALTDVANRMDFDKAAKIPGDDVIAIQARGKWESANRYHQGFRETFETATAQKFGRVEKGAFRPGFKKPGPQEVDQLSKAAFDARSPDAMRNLRRVVGDKAFNDAARQWMQTQYKASIVEGPEGGLVRNLFSAQDFERRLGLGTKEGDEAVKEMLRGTGVTVERFKKFIDTVKKATDITIRDPSTFLTRHLILGGSLAGGILIGGGHISLPGAAIVAWLGRVGSKKIMDPDFLRAATNLYKPNATDHMKRVNLGRLVRLSLEDKDAESVSGLREGGRESQDRQAEAQ